ncbi:ATPase,transcriptional regulator, luxR family [Mycobacterium sp. JS623]|uniref:helix-turn-helix transcriptional regulator n=1 Tax=Mycobacterium sp. JS623 TaxID=212767 RepID=UPI0002A560CF|nr:LuxR family transcriptional regulator [Mycobacterium sp. JS623]AGB21361.1 ATPase,transcriptional regulator, luxR family [Mycobacterium sp. JS623]
MPGVVSRPLEIRAISEFLQSAARQPSALIIEGEPGIGKTTLWLSAVERARDNGCQVFRAQAGRAESMLAYAAVTDLLRDVEETVLADLPDVQRLAVDRVLLRASSEDHTTDQRTVAAAFVAVFERLTAESQVLIAIDDAQWLDRSSQDVISFAARRLKGPVGLLLTERSDAGREGAASWLQLIRPDGVERLRVGPLSLGGLHVLISGRLGRSFPRPTMVRIAEISGGNPFFALELARAVELGASSSHSRLPASLSELMRLRIGRLDRDTRKLLLAAASVADPTVELLAEVSGSPVDSLDEAEAKGIVGIDGNVVRFTHPLLAQSVYADASAAERRAMHRSLAKTVTLPELRARHMALAASSADPETLEALDIAADEAAARGAPAAAAEFVELAIGLGGDNAQRRINGAVNHFKAGDPERARALLEPTLDGLASGARRGAALNLLAGIHLYDDNWSEAVAILERALSDVEDDRALLVQTLILLAFGQRMISKYEESLATARRAVTEAERVGDAALVSSALAMSVQLNFMFGNGVDEFTLRKAVELEDPDADMLIPFSASMIEGLILAWTGDLDAAYSRMEALQRRCTERGAENDLTAVVSSEAMIENWRGNLLEADRLAEEAVLRAEQGSGSLAIALSIQAMVMAYVGRVQVSRDAARHALKIASRTDSPRLAEWPMMTLGFLEVSLGHYAEALDELAAMQRTFEATPGTEMMTASFIPDAVEAMISLGRSGDAEGLIEALENNGRRLDRPWMLAVGARCRAMWLAAQGDVGAADAKAQEAMAAHDRLPMPFERARTQLLLGQLQRRQRQKERARATLREALESFEATGAPLWAGRVRAELARAKVVPTNDLSLTPSERRVAELAASGMTNKDVATALFISRKTVEANLARVYRKLGIKTRAELGRVIGHGH